MSESPPVILAGIGGGVAAYKAVEVVSRLAQNGYDVHVAMTAAGQQFVTPMTFAAVSRHRVLTEMFPPAGLTAGEDLFPHLYPASRADLLVVMPATADLLARLACGLGDDVVVCSALALRPNAARLFAPAMNANMWRQPVVQRNVEALEASGWKRIGPVEGPLACGETGSGRMAEPATILDAIETELGARRGVLRDRRVLILSGPTREPLDPVRFISNGSTGRMGLALARAARREGAYVDFITGPVEPERLPCGASVRVRQVTTAEEMLSVAKELAPSADILVFAAAVSDFRPVNPSSEKRPKAETHWTLRLEPTPDIAAEVARQRSPRQVAIGFALDSAEDLSRARAKRTSKQLDLIVFNPASAIGADRAEYVFIEADAEHRAGPLTKEECARRILLRAAELWRARQSPPQETNPP